MQFCSADAQPWTAFISILDPLSPCNSAPNFGSRPLQEIVALDNELVAKKERLRQVDTELLSLQNSGLVVSAGAAAAWHIGSAGWSHSAGQVAMDPQARLLQSSAAWPVACEAASVGCCFQVLRVCACAWPFLPPGASDEATGRAKQLIPDQYFLMLNDTLGQAYVRCAAVRSPGLLRWGHDNEGA
jgi:hypothetical protein